MSRVKVGYLRIEQETVWMIENKTAKSVNTGERTEHLSITYLKSVLSMLIILFYPDNFVLS